MEQPGDPVSEGARLARTSTRQHEGRTPGRRDRGELLIVEVAAKIDRRQAFHGSAAELRTAVQQTEFHHLFVGFIRGADQRARFDMFDASGEGEGFPFGEFVGVDPAIDGGVLFAGRKVLADGYDIDLGFSDVAQELGDFLFLLTDPKHQAGLSDELPRFGMFEDPEGTVIARGLTDGALEAFDRLQIMI